MNPAVRVGGDRLVEEIASSLAADGEYVCCVDSGPTQHLVDLHWCAHRAGRTLGLKVRVTMAEPAQIRRSDHVERVTMRVTPRPVEGRRPIP
jgi:hypothetical protein